MKHKKGFSLWLARYASPRPYRFGTLTEYRDPQKGTFVPVNPGDRYAMEIGYEYETEDDSTVALIVIADGKNLLTGKDEGELTLAQHMAYVYSFEPAHGTFTMNAGIWLNEKDHQDIFPFQQVPGTPDEQMRLPLPAIGTIKLVAFDLGKTSLDPKKPHRLTPAEAVERPVLLGKLAIHYRESRVLEGRLNVAFDQHDPVYPVE